ncbi:MAG: protein jag [Propionibacteriaceae bacterium]
MTDQTLTDDEVAVAAEAGEEATETEVVDETDAAEDDAADDEAKPSSSADVLENEGEIAADYLEELLDIADLDGDIDTYVEGGRAHVSIVTEGDMLVGSDGAVLEALQELARLAVMTETGRRSRLMLDIAGHRDRRRKELQGIAGDAISEVKESGEAVRLTPMNPFERKIVHDVVAAAGLVSESEGEEPRRCVVVRPA